MKPQEEHRMAAVVGLAILASTVVVGAGVSYAGGPSAAVSAPATTAAPDTVAPDPVPPSDPSDDADTGVTDCAVAMVELSDEQFAEDFASMSPDEQASLIAEMTKAAEELTQELDEAGVAYTLDVDPVTGVSWPIPDPDDPNAEALLDGWVSEEAVYVGDGADEFGGLGDFEEYFHGLDADEQAALVEESSKEAAAFAEELDKQGVDYTMETDPVTGVSWPTPEINSLEDMEAVNADCETVSEEFYSEDEFAEMFNSLSADEQAEMRQQMTEDAAAMAAELDAAGVAYTLHVDALTGVSWPTPDDPSDAGLAELGLDFEVDCDDEAVEGGVPAEPSTSATGQSA